MSLIATVNGVPVYSDKSLASIINTRVTFSDGSYVDVVTKKVVNKGAGYISLGEPPEGDAEEAPITRTETFDVAQLSLQNVVADVDVVPEGSKVVVTIMGMKDDVGSFSLRKEDGMVRITGGESRRDGVRISSIVSGGDVVIGGSVNRSFIQTSGVSISTGVPFPKISIKVPVGTSIDASGVSGALRVGDTIGALALHVGGQNKASVGKVGPADLHVDGQGKIRVDDVRGRLRVELSGQSRVNIGDGNVTDLVATTKGQSKFTYEGIATDAILSAHGMSRIDVAEVINKPVVHDSFMSKVRVRK